MSHSPDSGHQWQLSWIATFGHGLRFIIAVSPGEILPLDVLDHQSTLMGNTASVGIISFPLRWSVSRPNDAISPTARIVIVTVSGTIMAPWPSEVQYHYLLISSQLQILLTRPTLNHGWILLGRAWTRRSSGRMLSDSSQHESRRVMLLYPLAGSYEKIHSPFSPDRFLFSRLPLYSCSPWKD